MESLRQHEVPNYLVCVVDDFLQDRWVEYMDQNEFVQDRELYRSVPQESILGTPARVQRGAAYCSCPRLS